MIPSQPPRSFAQRLAQAGAKAVAQLPLSARWLDGMALAPIASKTEFRSRILAAIARQQTQRGPLVETNLGISDTIRAFVPVGKNDLIYGRPLHNVSERGTLELALVLSKQSDAFLDVGANEGVFAFSIATEPGRPAGASVHFFEPDVDLFNRVSSNVLRSKLPVVGNNSAVSDKIGIQTFYRNLDSDLSGSLTDHFANQHQTLKVQMPTTTIADYLQKHDVRRACLLRFGTGRNPRLTA
jgi:FkbM family methyltransferase